MDDSLFELIANDVYENTIFIDCGFPHFAFSASSVWIDSLRECVDQNYLELLGNIDADL